MKDEILNSASVKSIIEIFDYMPDSHFWIKDLEGKYLWVNEKNLRHYNARDVSQVQGKNDYEFCSRHLAEMYMKDDREVAKGKTVINKLEPVRQKDWSIKWHLTTKRQLKDKDGQVLGTFGIATELKDGQYSSLFSEELRPVIDYIRNNVQHKISIEHLADLSCLSVSAFERKFKKNFSVTPREYIKQIRLHLVCQDLIKTRKSISEIALDCGFYDHSFMTSIFKSSLGMTPSRFRKKFQ